MTNGTSPYEMVKGVFKSEEFTHEGMVSLLCNLQMAIACLPKGSEETNDNTTQDDEEMEGNKEGEALTEGAGEAQSGQ